MNIKFLIRQGDGDYILSAIHQKVRPIKVASGKNNGFDIWQFLKYLLKNEWNSELLAGVF
jgi:hypothetical protein